MFLTDDDLARLTGRRRKALQIAQLRAMGVPFFVNAAGRPIVARAAVEGHATGPATPEAVRPAWKPALVRTQEAR